ncbi:minichromosome maintenance protein 10 [Exophiala viscosa]|uniref:minichromosome maintenance protein 10 n=1 Tax=Exophiala viscosa TaxID=2486360 RepID=UPI002192DF1A|nr:minichromosome maintenance protein 10 [Exophiala viscosa]
MSHDASWPPVSPHAALLSSPSGRKKYEAYKNSSSPIKRSATTPSLVDRLRAVRKGHDVPVEGIEIQDEADDDEETLQLQLAAIEAKLKLKKLQQKKARAGTPDRTSSRPNSSHGPNSTISKSMFGYQEPTLPPPRVEVPKSPMRRPAPVSQPKSPSRVLLGIDKGVRGTDISLRRAKSVTSNAHHRSNLSSTEPLRPAVFGSARTGISTESRKTFSERMSEARDREKSHEQRRENKNRQRSKGFELDGAELEKYRLLAAEPAQSTTPPAEPGYTREQIIHGTAEANTATRPLEKSRTMPDLHDSRSSSQDSNNLSAPVGDASLFEGFSGLHLSSRVLPHSFLKRTLPTDRFTIYRVPDLLKNITSPSFDLPDSVCDYVVFGVIASKSSPMDQKKAPPDTKTTSTKDWERQWEDGSQNSRRFMVFTLTDLKWSIDLYLFGTAVPRYHRLTPGTVVAILNPGIMPPKSGKTDTGAFSLNLGNGDETVLEIGTARDLGYCKTTKKDGKPCGSWLNASKTEICEWHLNAQLEKTRAKRMGVNTGTNGFGETGSRKAFDKSGGRDGLLPKDGHKFDRYTGSHFYIATSNASAATGTGGSAHRGGMFDGGPSIPEGNLSRDREARVRKHMVARQKEREIAEKLGAAGHGQGFGVGSAGAEYLKLQVKTGDTQRAGTGTATAKGERTSRVMDEERTTASQVTASILSGAPSSALRGNGNGRKRTAEDVRLSPVKKTRFVTERGIREAGRESLGVAVGRRRTDESDDDLEIV